MAPLTPPTRDVDALSAQDSHAADLMPQLPITAHVYFSPLATEQGGCARSDSTHHLVDFALLGVADLIPLRMAVAEGAAEVAVAEGAAEVVVVDVVEGGQVAPMLSAIWRTGCPANSWPPGAVGVCRCQQLSLAVVALAVGAWWWSHDEAAQTPATRQVFGPPGC